TVVVALYIHYLYFLFFFQAEDGIRDGHVTGVQTCALPISAARGARAERNEQREKHERALHGMAPASGTKFASNFPPRVIPSHLSSMTTRRSSSSSFQRSEERRVGKECGCGWSAGH